MSRVKRNESYRLAASRLKGINEKRKKILQMAILKEMKPYYYLGLVFMLLPGEGDFVVVPNQTLPFQK